MAAGILQVAGWERFDWLSAGFSTRIGGETSAYGAPGEQNLGWTPEDDPAVVAANRKALLKMLAAEGVFELVTIRQVHGNTVQAVRRGGGQLSTAEGKAVIEGDGLMTGEPGMMLGIQTADCVPILVADTRTHAVAAFHAGWRGTVARIVEGGLQAMTREFGSRPGDLVAAIGPSIGPCCFEVGEDVGDTFRQAFDYAAKLVVQVPGGKPHVDLWEANRRQLLAAGVRPEAISVVGECTACSRTDNGRPKYFSYRAEQGRTGRMLSVIGTVAS